jgi:integrase
LKSAVRAQEFGADPRTVMPRYGTGYVPRTRFLTEDELLRVCACLETGRAAVVAFSVATSANHGETFRAQRGDITESGVRVRGTKRATRNRVVPVMAHVWPLLAFVLDHADGEGDMLFKPWSNVRRDLRLAAERAGVCPSCRQAGHERAVTPCLRCREAYVAPFSSNDLRRTCATWLVERGVPLNLAAKVLGHSSTLMLQKVYGQLDHEDVGRLINERVAGAH